MQICVWKKAPKGAPQQAERPQRRKPEAVRALVEVNPQDLEDGAGDNEGVEPVERRAEEVGHAQGVHANPHLKDESAEEQELCVVCKRRIVFVFSSGEPPLLWPLLFIESRAVLPLANH